MSKYIFVTGWVTSSIGKWIVCASLGLLFQSRWYTVTIQKCDPYINVDTTHMSPTEHGESYITEDGWCTDLDLGYYERFLGIPISQKNSITTGKIYSYVIQKERNNEYNGKTVQVVPHITDEIKARIKQFDDQYDIIITEIGGTVGDIEGLPYIEAIRQMIWELWKEKSLLIHLTLLPYLPSSKELKTKPTQHSIHQLMSYGLQADMLVCRSQYSIPIEQRKKLSLFCNIVPENVIECLDMPSIYEVPIFLHQQDFDTKILQAFHMDASKYPDLESWKEFSYKYQNPQKILRIAIVWPYTSVEDSYKSIQEAYIHAATMFSLRIEIQWIYSKNWTKNIAWKLQNIDGICLTSDKESTDFEKEILQHARQSRIPVLALWWGMQTMIDEYLRSKGIAPFPTQKWDEVRGGYDVCIFPDSLLFQIYQEHTIHERFHTTCFFSGEIPTGELRVSGMRENMIIGVENILHPFYVWVQFLPQFQSSVGHPHPIFTQMIQKIINPIENSV